MDTFIFINNQEFVQLRDAPLKLRLAPKFGSATLLWMLSFVFGVVSALVVVVTFIAVVVGAMRGSAVEFLLGSALLFLGALVAAVLLFMLAGWLDQITSLRKQLLAGKQRKYFVSSRHESFDLIFTPKVREHLALENSSREWAEVRALLSDQEVINADKRLLRGYANYYKLADARYTLIERFENFSLDRDAFESNTYFSAKRFELSEWLKKRLDKQKKLIASAEELHGMVAR